MIIVYSQHITSRLDYITTQVFTCWYGIEVEITDNPLEFGKKSPGFKINYSDQDFEGSFKIKNSKLLESNTTKEVEIEAFGLESLGWAQFDALSYFFYHLSRYEEYGKLNGDRHGRFPHTASVLFRSGLLEFPVVDETANRLILAFEKHFGQPLNGLKPVFSVQPTIDIDSVYMFKGKPVLRSTFGILRDLWQLNFQQIALRIKVMSDSSRDPFDCFDYLEGLLKEYGMQKEAILFIQVGKYGRFDKNIAPEHTGFRQIVKRLSKNLLIGIHPSYESLMQVHTIKAELNTLSELTGDEIKHNRFHYLRFKLPESYRDLIHAGIECDYSMGYSEVCGFRAGTSRPFLWYDLTNERSTALQIRPFAVMDVALRIFGRMNSEEGLKHAEIIKERIREAGGTYCYVFHNESLSEIPKWKSWRNVFEQLLKK